MSTKQFMSSPLSTIRILTLNLWGRDGAWTDRRAVLVEKLQALQPDLVALQEVIKTDEYDQILDVLGPQWNLAHQQVHIVRCLDDYFPCKASCPSSDVSNSRPFILTPSRIVALAHFPCYECFLTKLPFRGLALRAG